MSAQVGNQKEIEPLLSDTSSTCSSESVAECLANGHPPVIPRIFIQDENECRIICDDASDSENQTANGGQNHRYMTKFATASRESSLYDINDCNNNADGASGQVETKTRRSSAGQSEVFHEAKSNFRNSATEVIPEGENHLGKSSRANMRKYSLPPKFIIGDMDGNLKGATSEDFDIIRQRHSIFGDMVNDHPNAWTEQSTSSEFRLKNQLFSFFQAADNKLAMKLFGSRNALLREKRRQQQAHSWIVHPCSNFRLYWDLLMLILLSTNLVVLPVAIAFFFNDTGQHWMVFNITCDSMFILDIIVNFRTGLINHDSHGDVIMDPKVIASRYLKSWFAIDFLSSLPLDYFFLAFEGQGYNAGRALRILRLAKLLQLLRLLRISRLVRYIRIWQEFFSIASIVVRIFNLICVMVLMSHWSGCIQFFVPVLQGWPDDSWIALDNLQERDWWFQYTVSLFKALSHMLCIGYGQYPPRNLTDTWLTIASMVAGATCYALFIGYATTLIQSFDTSSRQFRDHLQQVNEYMGFRKLPVDLRVRVTDYYNHRYGGKMFDEHAILSEVSDSLRKDITSYNCKQLIETVPFFVNADPNFVTDVITKLEFEMFQPGDVIIKADTKGDKMYFIQEGIVEIVNSHDKVVTRLADGSYFGEVALLTQQKRTAMVRAHTYTNLFSLSKKNFDQILQCYPVMRHTLVSIAAQRLKHLGKDPSMVTSRESLLAEIDVMHTSFQDGSSMDHEENENEEEREDENGETKFLASVKGFFTNASNAQDTLSRNFSPKSKTNPAHNTNNSANGIKRNGKRQRTYAGNLNSLGSLDRRQRSPSPAYPRTYTLPNMQPIPDAQSDAESERSVNMSARKRAVFSFGDASDTE